MRIYPIILLVANMICSLSAIAHAERQPEDRKRADIVVSGEVNRVYVREDLAPEWARRLGSAGLP